MTKVGAIVVLSILKAERETEGGRLEKKKKRNYTDGTMGWRGGGEGKKTVPFCLFLGAHQLE